MLAARKYMGMPPSPSARHAALRVVPPEANGTPGMGAQAPSPMGGHGGLPAYRTPPHASLPGISQRPGAALAALENGVQ